jgi:hypothetical protein
MSCVKKCNNICKSEYVRYYHNDISFTGIITSYIAIPAHKILLETSGVFIDDGKLYARTIRGDMGIAIYDVLNIPVVFLMPGKQSNVVMERAGSADEYTIKVSSFYVRLTPAPAPTSAPILTFTMFKHYATIFSEKRVPYIECDPSLPPGGVDYACCHSKRATRSDKKCISPCIMRLCGIM